MRLRRQTHRQRFHSEPREESALFRFGPELQVLRAVYPGERSERAQDDSDVHLYGVGRGRMYTQDDDKFWVAPTFRPALNSLT